jgi:hypothetical protein
VPEVERLTVELRQVNEILWELEETVRRDEAENELGEQFVQAARAIIHTNDRRAALKQAINRVLGASFQEEKSFPLPTPVLGTGLAPTQASSPFEFFDVIFCISLDSRPERWRQAQHLFRTVGIVQRVERVASIWSHDPDEGRRLSHLQCVRRASAAGAETALIFEDDVAIPGFSPELFSKALDRLRAVPDWELCYVGGTMIGSLAEQSGDGLRAQVLQCRAYAIHRRAFATIERSIAPIELFYLNNLKSYCVAPMIACQRLT